MNPPNYTLREIEGRVAAMEDDCVREINEQAKVPMTATVIPEMRWLIEQGKVARKKAKATKEEPFITAIETEVALLEKRFATAISVGKFVALPSSLIEKMRALVDQLRADRKRAKIAEVEEFEEAAA